MKATPRTQPAIGADVLRPGAGRCEDAPDALSVQSQRADREVPEVEARDHVAHRAHFTGSELRGTGLRAAGPVIQVTRRLLTPGVVARRPQTDDAQGDAPGDAPGRSSNAIQDLLLLLGVRKTLRVQTQSRHSHQDEEQTDESQYDLHPTLEAEHALTKAIGAIVEHADRYHRRRSPPQPGLCRRAGYAETFGQVEITSATDELTEAVVVGVPIGHRAAIAYAMASDNLAYSRET